MDSFNYFHKLRLISFYYLYDDSFLNKLIFFTYDTVSKLEYIQYIPDDVYFHVMYIIVTKL